MHAFRLRPIRRATGPVGGAAAALRPARRRAAWLPRHRACWPRTPCHRTSVRREGGGGSGAASLTVHALGATVPTTSGSSQLAGGRRNAVSPVPAREPAAGEVLRRIRRAARPNLRELWRPDLPDREVLPRMRAPRRRHCGDANSLWLA